MIYRVLADAVIVIHLAFVLFVLLGGLLVLRWRKLAWVHLPAAFWGAAIEFGGWLCPLTPLESRLRQMGGAAGYSGGFLEQYLLSLVYPAELTRSIQMLLGLVVLAVNIIVYSFLWRRLFRRKTPNQPEKSRAEKNGTRF
jgi:hypothetical protein